MLKNALNVVAGSLALSLLATSAVAAHPSDTLTLTVAEYSAYLAEEAPDILSEFEALTSSEKEQYIDLLTNPDLYTDNAENLEGVDVGETSTAQTTRPMGDPNTIALLASSTDKIVESSKWVKALGVKVIEYKVVVRYRVSGGKVTKINSSSALVTRNLNPLVKTGQTSKSAWVSAGGASARLSATFDYNLGPIKGASVQIGHIDVNLTGYPNGSSKYNWYAA